MLPPDIDEYKDQPWRFKPCSMDIYEERMKKYQSEYWEENKEKLIEEHKQAIDEEKLKVVILRAMLSREKIHIDDIEQLINGTPKNKVHKIVKDLLHYRLIEKLDSEYYKYSKLTEEYLKH